MPLLVMTTLGFRHACGFRVVSYVGVSGMVDCGWLWLWCGCGWFGGWVACWPLDDDGCVVPGGYLRGRKMPHQGEDPTLGVWTQTTARASFRFGQFFRSISLFLHID